MHLLALNFKELWPYNCKYCSTCSKLFVTAWETYSQGLHYSALWSYTIAALLLSISHQLHNAGYRYCLFTQHKRILISFHFIIVGLNFPHKLDLYLTCHIDPHTVYTDQGREGPRPSIENSVPVDFAYS